MVEERARIVEYVAICEQEYSAQQQARIWYPVGMQECCTGCKQEYGVKEHTETLQSHKQEEEVKALLSNL